MVVAQLTERSFLFPKVIGNICKGHLLSTVLKRQKEKEAENGRFFFKKIDLDKTNFSKEGKPIF